MSEAALYRWALSFLWCACSKSFSVWLVPRHSAFAHIVHAPCLLKFSLQCTENYFISGKDTGTGLPGSLCTSHRADWETRKAPSPPSASNQRFWVPWSCASYSSTYNVQSRTSCPIHKWSLSYLCKYSLQLQISATAKLQLSARVIAQDPIKLTATSADCCILCSNSSSRSFTSVVCHYLITFMCLICLFFEGPGFFVATRQGTSWAGLAKPYCLEESLSLEVWVWQELP